MRPWSDSIMSGIGFILRSLQKQTNQPYKACRDEDSRSRSFIFRECCEKYNVNDDVFLVDSVRSLNDACQQLRFRYENTGIATVQTCLS
jgi:hypothetical protein